MPETRGSLIKAWRGFRPERAFSFTGIPSHQIDQEALACFSPYQTEHPNRFGRYALKRDRVPEPLDRVRVLRVPTRSKGLPTGKITKSVTI